MKANPFAPYLNDTHPSGIRYKTLKVPGLGSCAEGFGCEAAIKHTLVYIMVS